MTVRVHDYIRLAAALVNVPAMVMSASQWSTLIRVPLSVWHDPSTAFLLLISLAPPLSLVAIMVKPREA